MIIDNKEEFEEYINTVVWDFCMESNHPIRLSSAMNCDDQKGILMYGYFDSDKQILNTVRTDFPIGHDIFAINRKLAKKLLNADKCVNHSIGDTTCIIIEHHGFEHEYYCRSSDYAMMYAIAFNGIIQK